MPRDRLTRDLFEVPVEPAAVPGSMDHRGAVAHLVSKLLKDAPGDRYAVAADVSRLTGKEVSKLMLDGYSSEARDTFNLPFYLVPALEVACDSHAVTAWLATIRGGRLLVGRETIEAELGRVERVRDEATARARALREQLRRSR